MSAHGCIGGPLIADSNPKLAEGRERHAGGREPAGPAPSRALPTGGAHGQHRGSPSTGREVALGAETGWLRLILHIPQVDRKRGTGMVLPAPFQQGAYILGGGRR